MVEDLARYYPEDYYRLPGGEALRRAAVGEAPKLELMRPFVAGGQLVEIGSSFGVFALAARNAGFDVTAIEMDRRCCEYLEREVGVRAIESDQPQQALAELAGPVQAVALWHVLEHLRDPRAVLEAAADRLERGGVLALAMPNPDSLQFRLLGARWAHVDAPRHFFLIPFDALAERAAALGLQAARVTTNDPAGRYWNVFGWEHAIRRRPAVRPSTAISRTGARLLARAVAPLERRAMNGAAYTVIFVKS